MRQELVDNIFRIAIIQLLYKNGMLFATVAKVRN